MKKNVEQNLLLNRRLVIDAETLMKISVKFMARSRANNLKVLNNLITSLCATYECLELNNDK